MRADTNIHEHIDTHLNKKCKYVQQSCKCNMAMSFSLSIYIYRERERERERESELRDP